MRCTIHHCHAISHCSIQRLAASFSPPSCVIQLVISAQWRHNTVTTLSDTVSHDRWLHHSLTLYPTINDCTTQSDTASCNQWQHHTIWHCILQSVTAPHSLTMYPTISDCTTQSDTVSYNQLQHHTAWRCILHSVTASVWHCIVQSVTASHRLKLYSTIRDCITQSDTVSCNQRLHHNQWLHRSDTVSYNLTGPHSLKLYSTISDCITQSDTVFYNQWLHHTVWRCILQSVTAPHSLTMYPTISDCTTQSDAVSYNRWRHHSFSDAVLYNHWCIIQSATVSYGISYNQWPHHTVSPTQCHSIGDCTRLQRSIKQLPSAPHNLPLHHTQSDSESHDLVTKGVNAPYSDRIWHRSTRPMSEPYRRWLSDAGSRVTVSRNTEIPSWFTD